MYDVIIIGAGPAGLFAAYELSKTNKKILINLSIIKVPNVEMLYC